jgi:4-hydroxy-tetrahydrodipicolinate synthase
MSGSFVGVRPVLHLPFGEGSGDPIQRDELAALVRAMTRAGAAGLVALGLASEASALTEQERDEVLDTVITTLREGDADMRVMLQSIVVGVDGPTAIAAERAVRAANAGAAGLMVQPPRGTSSTAALARHFGRVADAAGLPILVQDSPQVTGVRLDGPTLLALQAAHPLVGAVKIESVDSASTVSTVTGGGMAVVAGWGGLGYLESVQRGAIGVMPGCDLAAAFVAIDGAARSGDAVQAAATYRQIAPLLSYETQSLERLILGAKRYLVRAGLFSSGRLRPPGRPIDATEAATLDDLVAKLEAAGVPGFGEMAR